MEFGASTYAVTAEDAFSGVSYERRRRGVDGFAFHELVVWISVDGEATGELLESAMTAFWARGAFVVVVGEEEL